MFSSTQDDFSRHRRNFLIASTVLALVGGAGVQFDGIPALAGAVDKENAWVAYGLLWLWCLYAATAFMLYFFAVRFQAFRKTLDQAKRKSVRVYLHGLGSRNGGNPIRTETCEEVSVWPMDVEVEIYKYFTPERHGSGAGRNTQNVVEQMLVKINRFVWAALVLRGMAAKLFFSMAFFEYLLPILWFVMAAALANSTDWDGEIKSIWLAAQGETPAATMAAKPLGFQQTLCTWREDAPHK